MSSTPRVRTRTVTPTPAPEPAPSRIQRHAAAPAATQARPRERTRTRQQALVPQQVAGMASGLVEVEHRPAEGQPTLRQERVNIPRKLPDGTFVPAMVRVSGGCTIQPRQYESVRIGVDLTLPCEPTAEGYESAYQEALGWITQKVEEQVQQVPILG